MKEILIATKNPNKAKEIGKIFSKDDIKVYTLNDFPNFPDIVEDGTTFEENARLKVKAANERLGMAALADDSGLQVDALYGQPGIRSARYAGDHDDAANNAKLLSELGGVPLEKRTAQFVTTLVYKDPENNQDIVATGKLEGLINTMPRGDDGFGYDPLFYVPELGKTLGQISMDKKNEISHRGRAIREFEKKFHELNN